VRLPIRPLTPWQAFRLGLWRGVRREARRFAAFWKSPGRSVLALGVAALSLVLHPFRNGARLLQVVLAWTIAPSRRRWRDLGEGVVLLAIAPTLLPAAAEWHAALGRFEVAAERARRRRAARLGRAAPIGRSATGSAVNQAVVGTAINTVPAPLALTEGTLAAIWRNSPDQSHNALSQVIRLIEQEAVEEVAFQTYLFDEHSPPARELLAVLAAKQRKHPGFRVSAVTDWTSLPTALRRAGIRAQVAIGRPLLSRRGQHTKAFILDGRIGVIGGENLNDPHQSDLMVQVAGPVVAALLAEFDDAWQQSAWKPGPPPEHARELIQPGPRGVPMACLGKPGVRRLVSRDPYDNAADQAMVAAIASARHRIKLQTPNLNAGVVLRALERAARRGVEIRACLSLNFNALTSAIDATSNHALLAYWADLPRRVQACFHIRDYSADGRRPALNHTKFLSVDGHWSYVGSQNLDNQSFAYSREFGIGFDDAAVTRELEAAFFDPDWARSLPVRPGWWARLFPYSLYDR